MNPINLIARLRAACPVGCRVEVHDDIDPHRVRVIWIYRIGGRQQAYDAWMRQEIGDCFDFDNWLAAVEKLMRREIAKMTTPPTRPRPRWPSVPNIYADDI